MQLALRRPTIAHDAKSQHEWGFVAGDISEYLKQPGEPNWPGLMAILDKHASLDHCAAGIGYSGYWDFRNKISVSLVLISF